MSTNLGEDSIGERVIGPDEYCVHCGKRIFWDELGAVWYHQWGRWPDDNGFWCYQDNQKLPFRAERIDTSE